MEGVSGLGTDVGALADAINEASNDWSKALEPLRVLSSSTAAVKLGSLSLDRVEGIIKAAEAAVQRHVEGAAAAHDAAGAAQKPEKQEEQGGEEGESKDQGKDPGNSAAAEQSDGTFLDKGGWEQLLVLSLEVLSAWLRLVSSFKKETGHKIAPAANLLITRCRDAALKALQPASVAPHMPLATSLLILAISIELCNKQQLADSTSATIGALRGIKGQGASFSGEAVERVAASMARLLAYTADARVLQDMCRAVFCMWGKSGADKADPWARVHMPQSEHTHMRAILLAFAAAARSGISDVSGKRLDGAAQEQWLKTLSKAIIGSEVGTARLYAAGGVLRAQSLNPSIALRRCAMSLKPLAQLVVESLNATLAVGQGPDFDLLRPEQQDAPAAALASSSSSSSSSSSNVAAAVAENISESGVAEGKGGNVDVAAVHGEADATVALSEAAVHAGAVAVMCFASLSLDDAPPAVARAVCIWMCKCVLGGKHVLGGSDREDRLDGHVSSLTFSQYRAATKCIEFHIGLTLKSPRPSKAEKDLLVEFVVKEVCAVSEWNAGLIQEMMYGSDGGVQRGGRMAQTDAAGKRESSDGGQEGVKGRISSAVMAAMRLGEATAMAFSTVIAACAVMLATKDAVSSFKVAANVMGQPGVGARWGQAAARALGHRVSRENGLCDELGSSISHLHRDVMDQVERGQLSVPKAAEGGEEVGHKGGGQGLRGGSGGGLVVDWASDLWNEEVEGNEGDEVGESTAVRSGCFYLRICMSKEMVKGELLDVETHKALFTKALYLALALLPHLSKATSDPAHDLVREMINSAHPSLSILGISYFPLYWSTILKAYPRSPSLRPLVASLVSLFRSIDGMESELPEKTVDDDDALEMGQGDGGVSRVMALSKQGRIALVASSVKELAKTSVDGKFLKLARMLAALIPHVTIECIDHVLRGIEEAVHSMPRQQSAPFLNFVFSVVSSGMDFVRRPYVTEWYLRFRNEAGFKTLRSKL